MNTGNLTDRDLKLLRFLGFIVIIGVFAIIDLYSIIKPMQAKDEQIEEEKEVHDTIEMKINNLDAVQTYVDDMQKRVDDYAERYYPMMDSTDIDRMITKMARERHLRAANLFIDMHTDPELVVPYPYSTLAKKEAAEEEAKEESESERAVTDAANWTLTGSYDNREGAASGKEEDAKTEEVDSTYAGVYAAAVTFKAYGEKEQLQDLLDELLLDRSMRIRSFSWDYSNINNYSYIGTELVENAPGTCALTIDLDVYMFDEDAYIEQETESDEEE